MCETRDVGIKWPQWRTLMFSHEIIATTVAVHATTVSTN